MTWLEKQWQPQLRAAADVPVPPRVVFRPSDRPEWSHGNPTLFDRPAIGSYLGSFGGCYGEPVKLASQRVLRRHDPAVVTTNGDSGPDQPLRLARKIDVHERHCAVAHHCFEHSTNPWL